MAVVFVDSGPLQRGLNYTEVVSGLRIEVLSPGAHPDRWRAYLDGAEERYRAYGAEVALDRASLDDGRGVSLFFVAVDNDNRVVAGLRCHGPLVEVADAHVLEEFAGHPECSVITSMVEQFLPHGLIEMKGGWIAPDTPHKKALSKALSRFNVHAMNCTGARYVIGSTAEHSSAMWQSSGATLLDGIVVPYPSDRYRTVMLWWERDDFEHRADAEQMAALRAESEELAANYIDLTSADPIVIDQLPGAGAGSWRPTVLDPRIIEDRSRIERLRRDPSVVVSDELAGQREELLRLRPPVPADVAAEGPRWVYYPWRRHLVSLLGPKGFRRLRLDRNRNKITAEEQAAFATRCVGVVGLSVGHAIAHVLAAEGLAGTIRLVDFDELALSNLNRVPATVLDLGLNKAVVAARRIAELDPYLEVEVLAGGLDAGNIAAFFDGLDIVVEECDSLDVKLLVREWARRRRIPVIMETSDRGLLDVERFDAEPARPAFHGLIGDLTTAELSGLATRDKVPHVLRILEPAQLSARLAASMAEIDETITTWPQLGSDVVLGAASAAAAVRRIGRGEPIRSGRVRIDVDATLDSLADPPVPPALDVVPRAPARTRCESPLLAIVQAAGLAPSGGNAQPWRFRLDRQRLDILLAPERTSRMDVGFRGSYVAIGAAVHNARVAASAMGLLGDVELFGDGTDPLRVASVRFGDGIDLDLSAQYRDVLTRCTNRRPGRPGAILAPVAASLMAEVEREGATLHLVTDRDRLAGCADILSRSDRLRYLAPELHREMMSELRWPGVDDLSMGIDVSTLELDATDQAKLAVARRPEVMAQLAAWGAGRALGDMTRDRVLSSSALAVVTAAGREAADYVRAGAALERLWLAAERFGLAVAPVSPLFLYTLDDDDVAGLVPPESTEPLRQLDHQFRELVGVATQTPLAIVLRLSHAPAPTARSDRLPLETLLVDTGGDAAA